MRRLALLLLLIPALASAAPVLRTLTLHHRSADEVVTLLKPLAPQGVSMVASDNDVLISGEPDLVAPMVEAVQKLDKAQKGLLITVREGGSRVADSQGVNVKGSAAKPSVRVYSTQDRDNPESTRQVRTLENQWARITTGIEVPIAQQQTTQTPWGVTTQQTTQYKGVDSGFEVRPRVTGDTVVVDVRTFSGKLSREGGGIIENASSETTVQGALGQWIDIGGSVEEESRDGQGIVYSTRSRARRSGQIQIKVEIAP